MQIKQSLPEDIIKFCMFIENLNLMTYAVFVMTNENYENYNSKLQTL